MALERPHPSLWRYYIICAILSGPAVFITFPFLYFRYHTLRYRFDAEGIHMRVGILFRSEINLTYARIQDIHLRSNFVQRWFGLANVQIQTASGSSGAEMVIEGFKEYEAIRDFLYSNMRGFHAPGNPATKSSSAGSTPDFNVPAANSDLAAVLTGIRDELRRTRELIESDAPPKSPQPTPPGHV